VRGSGRGLILSGTMALDNGQMKPLKNFRPADIKASHLNGHHSNTGFGSLKQKSGSLLTVNVRFICHFYGYTNTCTYL